MRLRSLLGAALLACCAAAPASAQDAARAEAFIERAAEEQPRS